MDKAKKTYVEIYKTVLFIIENHSKLFPTEIMDRVDITYRTLNKIASELNLELLNINLAYKVLARAHTHQKRKYKKRKKNLRQRIFSFFKIK